MKPPRRPRLIPARFLRLSPSPERPQRGPWGLREKRALLEALRAEAQRGLPEQRLAAALRERLPRRSEEEVWQDLAETLVGGVLEGPPRAAFSQVLTLAATEPLTLDHSRPPQNSGTPPHLEPSQNSGTPPEVGTPQNSGSPQSRGGLQVDFGRIYEFLARISAGGEGPPLPPAEAAVVLSLLGGSRSQTGGSQSHFGDPSSNLGFPVPNWGGPSPTLGGPSSNWANPSPTLGLPVPNWGSQSHCWGSQSQTGRC
ncbi:snRNA-activating protein complex subunit 2 isoform X5 [Vidua chalybeata]|uniref:snRNA-activating protein complex subunit 2 isoform X5 n=1 Tax=Vidua chalybeata TaxID=81927 RepID=UPI0023A8C188|nr:snRNA-activating protein complex subunit 2 isoform X5 [Vidua chalybeata]